MIKKLIVITLLIFLVRIPAYGSEVAVCSSSEGYSYYPNYGIVEESKSGMTKDKVTGGRTTLKNLGNNKYDILFSSADGSIASTIQDGGSVYPLILTSSSISVLNIYPGLNAEIYSFWKEDNGKYKYSMQQSRIGDNLLIRKINLLVGNCSYINFSGM